MSAAAAPIAVTGLGLVSPAGIGVETSWQRLLAGEPTAASDSDLADLPVDISCRVPGFDAAALLGRKAGRRLDRFTQLAIVAAREAVDDAGLDPTTWDGARVGVVIGCGMGGAATWEANHTTFLERGPAKVSPLLIPMLVPNMVAGQLAIEFGAQGPNLVTATACASGATAIGVARDLLRSGACDIVLAGGTEAGVTPLSVAGFAQMQALSSRTEDPASASRPFDVDRDGFVIAEGAGVLVLERDADATARQSPVYAHLSGYGASADAHHVTAPDPEGEGAARALRTAIADAGLASADITHVNAHGTSTPLNDVAESRMLAREIGEEVAVTSTKGVTGHALGAAGAIEAIATIRTIADGVIPPTANCEAVDPDVHVDVVTKTAREGPVIAAASNSFGFGGQNAVLVFTAA